jgi:hypothetical protein
MRGKVAAGVVILCVAAAAPWWTASPPAPLRSAEGTVDCSHRFAQKLQDERQRRSERPRTDGRTEASSYLPVGVQAVAPGSVAEQIGLQTWDILVRIGDEPVYALEDARVLEVPGAAVALAICRDGKPLQTRVEPGGLGVELAYMPARIGGTVNRNWIYLAPSEKD